MEKVLTPSQPWQLHQGESHEQEKVRVQELCESRGGRLELLVLISLMVSVDVKQH